jgi:aminocarboxymuconate-semialdehyde decarboxylase
LTVGKGALKLTEIIYNEFGHLIFGEFSSSWQYTTIGASMSTNGLRDARVIDFHAHMVLEETMGAAGEFGPWLGKEADGTPFFQIGTTYRLRGVKYVDSPFMRVDLRLQRMRERGIDFQIVSPNPLTYFHFIPQKEATLYCAAHNKAMARAIGPHPDRLAGLAALPLQAPQAAADELERSVRELGLLGAAFGTDSPIRLDDPALDVLYAKAVELDVPLYIHPGPAGIDGPMGDPALRRFDLDIISGFAAQETLAVATLIYGGVLDRHPKLDICVSHGGGATALMMGRMARGARKRPWARAELRPDGAFEERLKRLWFDTHVEHPRVIELLSAAVGADHLVFGTNFAGWDEPDATGIPSAHHAELDQAMLSRNARRLLRVSESD